MTTAIDGDPREDSPTELVSVNSDCKACTG